MNPALLQKQLRDNASDVNEFYNELKAWGEDMRRKEQPPERENSSDNIKKAFKKQKICEVKEKPKPKTGQTDYSAWDKFDAEAECEKIVHSENEDSDLTDEHDESVRDEAYVEKEKGNRCVKNKQWDEAIEFYNSAINCYAYDPIFYANRALCFLKKKNYEKAELDCTMSIRLDSTYTKAFHRRAVAREALGKLKEAEMDLLRALELEPNNIESSGNLEALREKLYKEKKSDIWERPVSKFTASRNNKRNVVPESPRTCNVDSIKSETDDIIPVKVVVKPKHLQSKKSLKRIAIQEIVGSYEIGSEGVKQSLPKENEPVKLLKTDDLKVIERHSQAQSVTLKEIKDYANNMKMSAVDLNAPTNSVQFYSKWKRLKDLENKYAYLKLIRPEKLSVIFKESLESDIFSEILEVLFKCYIKNDDAVFNWLKFLPEIKRFPTMVLFMTDVDRSYVKKLFDYMQEHEKVDEEQLKVLFKKFEL